MNIIWQFLQKTKAPQGVSSSTNAFLTFLSDSYMQVSTLDYLITVQHLLNCNISLAKYGQFDELFCRVVCFKLHELFIHNLTKHHYVCVVWWYNKNVLKNTASHIVHKRSLGAIIVLQVVPLKLDLVADSSEFAWNLRHKSKYSFFVKSHLEGKRSLGAKTKTNPDSPEGRKLENDTIIVKNPTQNLLHETVSHCRRLLWDQSKKSTNLPALMSKYKRSPHPLQVFTLHLIRNGCR